MNEENFAPPAIEQLLQNAEDSAWQWQRPPRPNKSKICEGAGGMFDKGLEICPNCERESRRKLENCEFCGQDKVPF